MNCIKQKKRLNQLFYLCVLLSILVFVFLQPFGDPPDEVNRYKIAQFICRYGVLPKGDEFEVAIGGYGGSYAFQPILPYILQGFTMRFFSLFTSSQVFLLLTARLINAAFGVIMAVYIRKMAELLFDNVLNGWIFSFLIMFLPQNLFLHSYVNTDSMASMSGAIILYACIIGFRDGWSIKNCLTLSAGITFCALSYYNAYGLILAAMLLFVFSCFSEKDDGTSFDWTTLFKRGFLIAGLVLLMTGWWFFRNYMIHDGDFLGLAARTENSIRTALPEYNPLTRATIQNSGTSLYTMLFQMDFFYFLWNSFVARFGPMTIPTFPFLYIWYYRLYVLGFAACLLPPFVWKKKRLFFHIGMLTAVMTPLILCIFYSYTSDYQPQGRYIMPMLIPFMYFVTLGLQKLKDLPDTLKLSFKQGIIKKAGLLFQAGVLIFLALSLILTLAGVVIPHYLGTPNLWNAPFPAL